MGERRSATAASSDVCVEIKNCYYKGTTQPTDQYKDNILTVKFTTTSYLSENDFANETNFIGWDFENAWEIGAVNGKVCPVLK